jgi:uncharacterized protein (DUF433 family)
MNDRIAIDPNVCHGQACIRGTRIPVHQVVAMMANGDSIEDLLEAYPSITRNDILACLDYAARLAEEQIAPVGIEHAGGSVSMRISRQLQFRS